MISSWHSFWLGAVSGWIFVLVGIICLAWLSNHNSCWEKKKRLYKKMQKFATKHNVTIVTSNYSYHPEKENNDPR
jgi:hypothetical protein